MQGKKTNPMSLNLKQVKTLKDKGYKVKSNGFHVTLYNDDFKGNGWADICRIAGVNPKTTNAVTLACFGSAIK